MKKAYVLMLLGLMTASSFTIYSAVFLATTEPRKVVKPISTSSTNICVLESTKTIEPETQKIETEVTKKCSENIKYKKGWIKAQVLNIRDKPDINGKIVGHLYFNDKIEYSKVNKEWSVLKNKHNKTMYINNTYISNKKCEYKLYNVPSNRGFKSYMDYRCITSVNSLQYKMQHNYAYTGNYGIRQINGRYCVAVGSYFTTKIGKYFDLILENGTVIPCILADQKADKDTDCQNIKTAHNGCVSEFVVDIHSLNKYAKRDGDISSCNEDWKSPVSQIRVYNKNIMEEKK